MTDAAFEEFLRRYERAWSCGDFRRVRELWIPGCEEPWHFPEELAQPIVGWEALDRYLQQAQKIIDEFRVEVSDAHWKYLAPELALFRLHMAWSGTLAGEQAPLGARVRVSGVLRLEQGEFRLMHYMEAGPAALPFIRAVYEEAARTIALGGAECM